MSIFLSIHTEKDPVWLILPPLVVFTYVSKSCHGTPSIPRYQVYGTNSPPHPFGVGWGGELVPHQFLHMSHSTYVPQPCGLKVIASLGYMSQWTTMLESITTWKYFFWESQSFMWLVCRGHPSSHSFIKENILCVESFKLCIFGSS